MTYDAAGNLIEKTAGSAGYTYQYDPHNRLASIVSDQSQIAAYQYNGLGQRVVKQTGEGNEYSLYDLQGRRIAQLNSGGELLHNTLYWQGQPLAQYRTDPEGVYRFLSTQPHRDAELSVDINTRRIRLLREDGCVLDTVIDAALWQIDTTGAGTVYHFTIGQGADQALKGWMRLPADGKGFAHIMDKTQGHPQEYRLDERERRLNAYYYHLDHLRTPQVITDKDQNIVWQASYAPFGQTTVTRETIDNDLRFPGQYHDRESGLHYNWNRYYDPSTGRYVQSDPIGLEGGLNTYTYALNNPLRYIDPSGMKTWLCKRPLGDEPGTKGGLLLHHSYACVTDSSGNIICNSTTVGGGSVSDFLLSRGQPTSPKDDYYDKDSCSLIEESNDNCEEQCIIDNWSQTRPKYGIGPQGTDCREYTDDIIQGCLRNCWNKNRRQ